MWIKCIFFFLILNQAFGLDNHFVTQDSVSNQKFTSEFKSIQLIKNEKKREKLMLEFVNNHVNNGDLFKNYAHHYGLVNVEKMWITY
jgi:hypothetical protein